MMRYAHSSRPGHDETMGSTYARYSVSAATPGETRALSFVDYHHIPPEQESIHKRLLEWARWVNGSGHPACSPTFRNYRSSEVWSAPEAREPINTLDASDVEKAVATLEQVEREAIRWHYARPIAPHRVARDLGLTRGGLAQAVIDGRETLKGRI